MDFLADQYNGGWEILLTLFQGIGRRVAKVRAGMSTWHPPLIAKQKRNKKKPDKMPGYNCEGKNLQRGTAEANTNGRTFAPANDFVPWFFVHTTIDCAYQVCREGENRATDDIADDHQHRFVGDRSLGLLLLLPQAAV